MDLDDIPEERLTVKFIYRTSEDYNASSTSAVKQGTIRHNPPVVLNTEQSDIEDIVIVPIRDLSYEEAKAEISQYIQNAGDRKVYISELAEELSVDIDLIIDILTELETS